MQEKTKQIESIAALVTAFIAVAGFIINVSNNLFPRWVSGILGLLALASLILLLLIFIPKPLISDCKPIKSGTGLPARNTVEDPGDAPAELIEPGLIRKFGCPPGGRGTRIIDFKLLEDEHICVHIHNPSNSQEEIRITRQALQTLLDQLRTTRSPVEAKGYATKTTRVKLIKLFHDEGNKISVRIKSEGAKKGWRILLDDRMFRDAIHQLGLNW